MWFGRSIRHPGWYTPLDTSSAASLNICCRYNCIYVKACESLFYSGNQALILNEIFSLVRYLFF